MLRVFVATILLTLTPGISTSETSDEICFSVEELQRVDPAKVLALIKRIKQSGGSGNLPNQ